MSSAASRSAIVAAITAAAAPWAVKDLSDYLTLKEALPSDDSTVALVQFVLADESVQSTGGEGNQMWLESGTVGIHLVAPITAATSTILAKADAIRQYLRGKRLTADLYIESCEPFTDFGGAPGLYPGHWKGWVANLYYEYRTCG